MQESLREALHSMDLALVDDESRQDSYKSASTSRSGHGPSNAGEEFGVELARVVNDVKARQKHTCKITALKVSALTHKGYTASNLLVLQAGDIRLLHVAELVYWTSYLVSTEVWRI